MPTYYNLSNFTDGNITDFLQFTQLVDSNILGGMLGFCIMLMIFGVFFFAILSRGEKGSTALVVACWVVGISAMLLRPMGLLTDYFYYIGLMLIPIGAFVAWLTRSSEV